MMASISELIVIGASGADGAGATNGGATGLFFFFRHAQNTSQHTAHDTTVRSQTPTAMGATSGGRLRSQLTAGALGAGSMPMMPTPALRQAEGSELVRRAVICASAAVATEAWTRVMCTNWNR